MAVGGIIVAFSILFVMLVPLSQRFYPELAALIPSKEGADKEIVAEDGEEIEGEGSDDLEEEVQALIILDL